MSQQLQLRYMGFCGVDDSVNPGLLLLLSRHYPWIEWGMLFRPDQEGQARYASKEWLDQLISLMRFADVPMNLAGHLCGSRCEEVLNGDYDFMQRLAGFGFRRIQINATRANNVHIDPSMHAIYVKNVREGMKLTHGQVEWIIQCNEETKFLWEELVKEPEPNLSILFDASCGLGKLMTEYSKPYADIPCGYAGGIGPKNIASVLAEVQKAADGVSVWIDMESSLRVMVSDKEVVGRDAFSIDKCFDCIRVGVDLFKFHEA
jgi:hypothetical protein